MIVNNNGLAGLGARKDETLFLLLTTRAILIAYLNMKFARLARPGPAGLEKLVIQIATHRTRGGLVRTLCRKEILTMFSFLLRKQKENAGW